MAERCEPCQETATPQNITCDKSPHATRELSVARTGWGTGGHRGLGETETWNDRLVLHARGIKNQLTRRAPCTTLPECQCPPELTMSLIDHAPAAAGLITVPGGTRWLTPSDRSRAACQTQSQPLNAARGWKDCFDQHTGVTPGADAEERSGHGRANGRARAQGMLPWKPR